MFICFNFESIICKIRAEVVSTRSHVQYIITENGTADLYGKTLKDRAMEMIKIAHPDHQEWIDKRPVEDINLELQEVADREREQTIVDLIND